MSRLRNTCQFLVAETDGRISDLAYFGSIKIHLGESIGVNCELSSIMILRFILQATTQIHTSPKYSKKCLVS